MNDFFNQEFQALSGMADTLDDAYSRKAHLPKLMNNLRRKCVKYLRTPDNVLDDEAKKLIYSRPTKKDYYQPLKDLLMLLDQKLDDLYLGICMESGDSLEIASEIDVCLTRLKPFINAMRLSPRLEKSPCDPDAFSYCRARYLSYQYVFFLVHLSSIFTSYKNLFQLLLIDDFDEVDDDEFDDLRNPLGSDENGTYRLINSLSEVFDRPHSKILRGNWERFMGEMDDLIDESVDLINLPHVKYNPKAIPTQIQSKAFILIAKLCRLLINKLSKFTNQPPHLSFFIPFNELEALQSKMEVINTSILTLQMSIDIPRRPTSNINAMDKLVDAVEEIYETLQDFFEYPEYDIEAHYAPKMHEWCNHWKSSFDSAIDKYDLYFGGKNYWKRNFHYYFSSSDDD